MKRIFDIFLALILAVLLLPLILLIGLFVKITSKGEILFFSDRIGQNNIIFSMPKFRTMDINTPQISTHLLQNPDKYLTSIGGILRRSSLDELPQLWSVFKGDMSFVGPRPALYNQDDLVALRSKQGVDQLLPGITGWAQINGRDALSIPDKVALEVEYLHNKSFGLDLKILWLTFLRVIKQQGISH